MTAAILAGACGGGGSKGGSDDASIDGQGTESDAVADAGGNDVAGIDASGDVAKGEDADLLPDAPTDAARGPDDADAGTAGEGDPPPETVAADVDDAGEASVSLTGLCAGVDVPPWSRPAERTGGAVVFTELMFDPPGDGDLEWLELHNPFAIDMDLSDWRLTGGVDYAFPDGTVVAAGGYVVIAAAPKKLAEATGFLDGLGPYEGKLSNGGERIELRSNAGRLMDAIEYDDAGPWPATPGGSGVSLAKVDPTAPSPLAEGWAPSLEMGGTPGQRNFPDPLAPPEPLALVAFDAIWDWTTADPGPGWEAPGFPAESWSEGEAPFYAGEAAAGVVATAEATATADNFFAFYVGHADGTELRLAGRDEIGDWSSPEVLEVDVTAEDHAFFAAWEAPGGSGGPQMFIAGIERPDGSTLGTATSTFEVVLGPPGESPGGSLADPPPDLAAVSTLVASADLAGTWAAPLAEAPKSSAPWGGALSGAFDAASKYVWPDTFGDVSATNADETYALFRSKEPIVPPGGVSELPLGPTVAWFRTSFAYAGDPALATLLLDVYADDGAVFYLNGVEVHRQGLPEGPLDAGTLAAAAVGEPEVEGGLPISAAPLAAGTNVFAAAVYQSGPGDTDMAFAAALTALVSAPGPEPPAPSLTFHEVAGGGAASFWVELANPGDAPIDGAGFVVATSDGESFLLPPGVVPAGGLLLLDEATLGFGAGAGDALFLYRPDGGVSDGVEVTASVRAREAPGLGPWRYVDTATPGEPNQLALHDEVVIDEIMYHHRAVMPVGGGPAEASPEEWIELYNRTGEPVDVGGWKLVDGAELEIAPGTVIPPFGFLVLAADPAALSAKHPGIAIAGDLAGSLANGGERVALLDGCGNLVDEVRWADGGRWPEEAGGGGSSLELRDPRADGEAPEAWAASEEASKATWQEVSYEGVAAPSAVGPDGQWQEFVIGLLDAGVVLVDDLSVVEDPGGAAVERLQAGTFDSGEATAWRLLGNHRHSEVVPDPDDPSNPVLRLVATGPTEHMHNHAETTLAGGAKIANGKTYRISYRARWEAGSGQLHTRLYFQRLAKTTRIAPPESHGTPGAPNSRLVANLGPTFRDLGHTRVVPAPFEPVVVHAVLEDPDGVAAAILWTSVDGGAPESAAMADVGGGRFETVAPGAPAGAIVQMWVEAEDGLGATSSFPAGGAAARALWRVAGDDDGTAAPGLPELRILLTPADAEWLHGEANLMSNDLVGATVVWEGREVWYDAGVRLKGSERGRPEVPRLGYALAFPADRPFRGVHRTVLVDRSEGVGFGQREMLMNLVMARAGSVSAEYDDVVHVVTPRPEHTGPAELQLARFSDLFLETQFESGGDGPLYEYELVYYPLTTDDGTPEGLKLPQPDNVVGKSLKSLGPDPEATRWIFLAKNRRWEDDRSRLQEVLAAFDLAGGELHAAIGDFVDVDQWLRSFAFATLSGAIDNYASGAQHNAVFYVRPEDQRLLYFPHDLDFLGGPTAPLVGNQDLAELLAFPPFERQYYGHLLDVVETSFSQTYLGPWCDQLGALLPGQDFAGHCSYVATRAKHVLQGASDAVLKAFPEVPFAITTEGGLAFSTTAPEVVLEGQGWIDVREIRRLGSPDPLAVTWLDGTTWQLSLPLAPGPNPITLQARNHQGEPAGQDAIAVTLSPPPAP